MILIKKLPFFIFFACFCFLPTLGAGQAKASETDSLTVAEYSSPSLPAPTLVRPSKEDILGSPKPKIIGLSVSQSFVHIYIDGVYNGHTGLLSHESGTANFLYTPFLNLKPGSHQVQAIAEDSNGKKSEISKVLEFKIEKPMPAPTLFKPVINASSTPSQPFIAGLAKNNSSIKVYIDHKLTGKFLVKNHESGTANFAYKPIKPLARGSHLIYTTAVDSRGKESQWSNIIYFSARQPIIADSAAEENAKISENGSKDVLGEEKEPALVISPNGNIQKAVVELRKDEKRVDKQQNKPKTANSGAITESKQKQNRLSPNIVVFIIFLLGIIGWIIWVNRELAKERREQEQKEIEPASTDSGQLADMADRQDRPFGQASADAPTDAKAMADRQSEDKKEDGPQTKKD